MDLEREVRGLLTREGAKKIPNTRTLLRELS
jgi:hypothetical protein